MVPAAKLQLEDYLYLQQLDPSTALEPSESLELAKAVSSSTEASSSTLLRHGVLKGSKETGNGEIPSQLPTSSGEFPVYALVIVAFVFFIMTSTFMYFLCRCLVRKKKRENQLATLTPKAEFDHRMAGVRANQPIEFVVPTTVIVSETTEDSVSETDYSSSGTRILPSVMDRRKRRFQINPEDLQHGLYLGVTAASSPSEKGTYAGDLGKVGFSLRYSLQRSQLSVRIIGAKDLPCHSMRTTANPCVKLVLLPDRTTKYMTKVIKNTTNPNFDETFTFCVRREELCAKKLKISVWDYDRFSRKCLIGQVLYNVKDSGLTNTLAVDATSGEIWVDMKHDSGTTGESNGEVLLSLCYNPDSSVLTLNVLKARGLSVRQDRPKDTAVYAKVTLYADGKLVKSKKTPSLKMAPEVEFGSHPFSIRVPQAALGQVDLAVALCEKWPLGGKRVLGRTRTGADCLADQGLQHWQDMLASPRSTCAQWHTLCG